MSMELILNEEQAGKLENIAANNTDGDLFEALDLIIKDFIYHENIKTQKTHARRRRFVDWP